MADAATRWYVFSGALTFYLYIMLPRSVCERAMRMAFGANGNLMLHPYRLRLRRPVEEHRDGGPNQARLWNRIDLDFAWRAKTMHILTQTLNP